MKRWKVALTFRAGSEKEDQVHVVTDLAGIGAIMSRGPADWGTAYLCVTALAETADAVAEPVPVQEAAA